MRHVVDRWRANDKADQAAARRDRAVVRARREPGRLPVHVRRRAAVAQEPARQRRRRPDHDRRRRRPQPQLSRTTSATTRRARRRSSRSQTYRGPSAGLRGRDAGDEGPARPGRLRLPGQLALGRRVAALRRGLAGRARRPPTTRSTSRCRATSTSRRSPASIRASAPTSSTSPTARRRTTRTRRRARWRGRRSSARAADGLRLRVPGRRGARAGGVRAQRCRSRSSVAKSADDPDDPESSLGIETKPFYLRATTRTRTGIPGANFDFAYSYGDPQPVAVLAKRSLGKVTLKYRINGGPERARRRRSGRAASATTPADVYYREMRGVVTRHRRRATPSRSGSRAAGDAQRVVHVPGGVRDPATACSSWPPRTTPAPRRCRRPGRTTCSTTSTRWRRTASAPTSTTSTRAAGPRRTTSACSATTTASSGTRATTS